MSLLLGTNLKLAKFVCPILSIIQNTFQVLYWIWHNTELSFNISFQLPDVDLRKHSIELFLL